MGGPARTALAFRLTRLAREATRAGIRARHPEYDEDAVRRAFSRLLHGDAVTREVWPALEARRYLQRFRKAVMMIAFVKSMKNAPTIGTTR